ncbi:unnamed protein product [Ectocarpus sp. CCAP 1310/34]|nr:unnamed protein product [Ectocarpus sp. CCAP 1310/34]
MRPNLRADFKTGLIQGGHRVPTSLKEGPSLFYAFAALKRKAICSGDSTSLKQSNRP